MYIEEGYYPQFHIEPIQKCPECGESAHAEWVDNGFGPYAIQAGPFQCECGWIEGNCPANKCIKDHCTSWDYCQGKAKTTPDREEDLFPSNDPEFF